MIGVGLQFPIGSMVCRIFENNPYGAKFKHVFSTFTVVFLQVNNTNKFNTFLLVESSSHWGHHHVICGQCSIRCNQQYAMYFNCFIDIFLLTR